MSASNRKVIVVEVVDGDSLVVRYINESRTFRLRLFGIDAPESSQPYGPAATEYLCRLALDKQYNLDIREPLDRYGRVVGILYRYSPNASLNHMMVSKGFAYVYRDYGILPGIVKAEQRAKHEQLGVWQQTGGGIRPWDWRHGGRARVEAPPSPRLPSRTTPHRRRRWPVSRPVSPKRPSPTPTPPRRKRDEWGDLIAWVLGGLVILFIIYGLVAG